MRASYLLLAAAAVTSAACVADAFAPPVQPAVVQQHCTLHHKQTQQHLLRRHSSRLHMRKGFGGSSKGSSPDEPITSAGRGPKAMQEQMRQFQRIKDAGGVVTDLYARAPGADKFFFVGKIATGLASVEQAVHLHKAMAAEYVRMIVPDLPERLEFFVAPGNTEIAVARNEMGLKRAFPDGVPDLSDIKNLREVGFMPEPYGPGEKVFYTRKGDDGSCTQPPSELTIAPMPPGGLESLGK